MRRRAPLPPAPVTGSPGLSEIGRTAVRGIIGPARPQYKVDVSAPGDTHEKEADRVAEQVMRQETEPKEDEKQTEEPLESGQVQQQAVSGSHEEEPEPDAVARWMIQRQAAEEANEDEEPVATDVGRLAIQRLDTDEPPEEEAEPVADEVARSIIQRQETAEEPSGGDQLPAAQPGESDPAIDVASASQGEPEPLPEPDESELELMSQIQAKAASRGPPADVTSAQGPIANRISAPTGGTAVPSSVLRRVEPAVGADLSHVRVHSSVQDRSDAVQLQARAFTYRSHVFLGPGERPDDVHLMSHELTHVVQQGAAVRRQVARPAPRPWVSTTGEKVQRGIGDWILDGVAKLANNIPGFSLLTVFLGKNPITDQPVPRNAVTLTRGVLGLLGPVGEQVFQNLNNSGAIERAYAWLSEQIAALGLTWSYIKALFREAWESIGITDGVSGALEKVKRIFGPPLSKVLGFGARVVGKIKEFVIQGVLGTFGETGKRVADVLLQARDTFDLIVSDPVGFARNIIGAISKGFTQFKDNIVEHLKKGFMGWLFGTLSSAGLQLPEKLDLRGILSIVMQVLGLTYANVRTRLVKAVGESRVQWIETAFEFVKLIATQGIAAAWQKIVETIGNLKAMVIDAIKNWVIEKVVMSAVSKLIGLFFPASAVIEAIKAIYNTVVFFIERAQQILALVESVVSSVGAIARGQIDVAANFVEQTMSRTIPVIISFLARLVGLGGIGEKIRKFITDIQAKVWAAIDKLVNAVVKKAKDLLAAGKAKAAGAVAAVKDWWKARRKFKAGDEDHELYFEGSGEASALTVASPTQKTVRAFLDGVEARLGDNGARKLSYKEARALHKKIDSRRQRLNKARAEDAPAETVSLEAEMADLSTRLAVLMQSEAIAHGETVFTVKDVNSDGLGVRAVADPLTPKGAPGSAPSVSNPVWATVNLRRFSESSDASFYVRGHLINHNVHGPGNRAWNLTPITRYANKRHLDDIETAVKTAVNDKGKTLKYDVKAVYPRSTRLDVDGMLTRAESLGYSDGQRKTLRRILDAENRLPDRLEAEATILEPGPNGAYAPSKDEKFTPNGVVSVKNDLPTDLPPRKYTPES